MSDSRFPPGWLQDQVARSVSSLARLPKGFGGTGPATPHPPMTSSQITDVTEGILDDWIGDAEPATRHREIAEALTESWLKDCRRAVAQESMDTGSNLNKED